MERLRCLLRIAAIALIAAAWACDAAAQPAAKPASPAAKPAANEQLEAPVLEPLPPVSSDAELEPQVTIKRKGGETVEEARVHGRVVWIKVTPGHGRPYYLIPTAGGNTYIRRDSFDTGLSVPLWVLFTF